MTEGNYLVRICVCVGGGGGYSLIMGYIGMHTPLEFGRLVINRVLILAISVINRASIFAV